MKKQILFLTLFVAAILGGMNAYGQVQYDDALDYTTTTPACISPTTLTCFGVASALKPAVGVPYTYTITSTDAANSGNEKVHWFVVNNADLGTDGLIATQADMAHIAALVDPANGTEYLLSATSGVYNIPVTDASPNTTDAITLSWNYFNGQSEVVLLVAYVYDALNCTDNIEVYRIFPQFSFTLDIAAIDQDDNSTHMAGASTTANECVSPIESASYSAAGSGSDSPGDGTLTVDYGENYLYFMVNAANFVGGWDPIFDFTYDGVGTITDADWTYPNAADDNTPAVWHEIDISSGLTDATSATKVIAGGGAAAADGTSLNAVTDLVPVGADGECIIVRVRIDHGTSAENTVLRTLNVAVDGVMYDPTAASGSEWSSTATLADFEEDDGADADLSCLQNYNDGVDNVDFEITPRPNIITTNPTPFEQNTGDNNGVTPFTPVTGNDGSSTN